MHAVGLHSALAIRRERRRRAEQQRARERRYSLQSSESGVTSPHCSTGSLERRRPRHGVHQQDQEVVSSVGMLHLGVVFLVLGLFLVGSGWLPDDVTSWSNIGSVSWFNELVCSGLFAIFIGLFLVALHKYLTKSEEDALEEYVQRQLTRSRSGHRLERDSETGGMQTKHARRARATEVLPPPALSPDLYTEERAHGFVNALALNGEALRDSPLEQIAEEDPSLASLASLASASESSRRYPPRYAPSLSLSPGSPSDTRELLPDGRYMIVSRM